MKRTAALLQRCWRTLQAEESAPQEQAEALAVLRTVIAEDQDGGVSPITDPWWQQWGEACAGWADERDGEAEALARELGRACQGRAGPARPDVAPDLLFLAATGLQTRCLADRFLRSCQQPHAGPDRKARLAELARALTALESRIQQARSRGWAGVPVELDA